MPPGFHAGGLRYHGMAPLVSHVKQLGLIDAKAYHQTACFEAGVFFARHEGIVPAPEANHAVKGAIDEALKCKQEGVARTINPKHDIWKAADPVVRRWIIRELSPPARIKRLMQEGTDLLRLLKLRLEEEPAAVVVAPRKSRAGPVLWFILGAAIAGAAFTAGMYLR